MKHAISMTLHAYWQRRGGDGGVPAGAIRAAELADILPCLFLLDLSPPTSAPFRFCGPAVAMRYGRDLTNESFLALWDVADCRALAAELAAMKAEPTGLLSGVVAETVGGGFSAFEMLLLPLGAGSGAHAVLGSMARVGGHREADAVRGRILSQSLRSMRFLSASGPPEVPELPSLAIGCLAAERRRRPRPHLKVIAGGRSPARRQPLLTDI